MYKIKYKIFFLTVVLAILSGCTADDSVETLQEDMIPVRFEIEGDRNYTRAPGDVSLSVNRILILPFKKSDENLSNATADFLPVYSAAKQLDVNSFPAVATMLNLSAASTYQIMVIGYNRNDYDFTNQGSTTRRFDIGSTVTPATMSNMYLKPISPVVVPEFFTCLGNGYMQNTSVGAYFKPGQINNVRGTLTRLVSGLTLEVSSIPGYVNSVKLVAEQLVTATRPLDGNAMLWQTSNDAGAKILGTQSPLSGKVSFNLFMLPIPNARKTQFYLDVSYGIFTDRYTVKVPDTSGVSSNNRIIFTPNHWVKITGDYSKINFGFTIADAINLDDDAWDGLVPKP